MSNESSSTELPLVRSVLHPTDFSEASDNAFAHALALALRRQTKFAIIHAGGKSRAGKEWTKFPSVRATLERWGFLEKGSPRSAVFEKLAMKVEKIDAASGRPLAVTLDYLEKTPTDLIVLATEGREGVPRWIRPSKAEEMARRSETLTLFVPDKSRGFVSLEDGRTTLRNILIPIDRRPSAQPAIQFATRGARILGDGTVAISLLHIGDSPNMPPLDLPEDSAWSWNRRHQQGDVVEEIIKAAHDVSADMIVMVTEGREGFLDALRGSVTEQVLRQAPCPLLAVPTAWVEKVSW